MHRRSRLSLLALAFIVPISLLALVLTSILLAAYLGQSDFDGFRGPNLAFAAVVVGGWIGLASLWSSYFHFRRSEAPPRLARLHLVALGVGCIVSVALAALALQFSFVGLAILLGSPLVAALIFVAWIGRTRAGV